MSAAPSFKTLTIDIDQETIDKAGKSSPKFFGPGRYKLMIKEAAFHAMGKKDSTWAVYKVTLGEEKGERTIRHFVLVPTKSLKYGDSKRPLSVFFMFADFMAAIGEDVRSDVSVVPKVATKYFTNPTKLVGKEIELEIGYNGQHISYKDGQYFIATADGHPIDDARYENRDDARAAAARANLMLQDFPEIMHLFPAISKAEDAVDGEDWE